MSDANSQTYYVVSFLTAGVVRYLTEFRIEGRPIFVVSKADAHPFAHDDALAFTQRLIAMNVNAAMQPAATANLNP